MNETYDHVCKQVDKKFPTKGKKYTKNEYKSAIKEIDNFLNQL